MNPSFTTLSKDHFPLLLKWLNTIHVKKWWDQDVEWTSLKIHEKYESYVQGYKIEHGKKKTINAYIILYDNIPVGYIQIYNAYDFERSHPLANLHKKLAAFDIFIGEEAYLNQGIASKAIASLLYDYRNRYTHAFADPEIDNLAAIRTYEKAGFKRIHENYDTKEVWMIKDLEEDRKHHAILEELKAREPIFHHPDKFGRTKEDILAQICDDFWEVGASGNVYTKEQVLATFLLRYNDPGYQDIWETKDFELKEIAPDNYLLTYVLIQDKTRITRRSTIWRKIGDDFKILYHQGTIIQEQQKKHQKYNLEIIPSTIKDYPVIQNMARFYVYDMSRSCGFISEEWNIPADGLYECFDFRSYFEDSSRKPYIIKCKDELVGFVLINKVTTNPTTDYNMGEFFILAKFQGKNIGNEVANRIWNLHQGKWEVSVIPENKPAYSFWKKIISKATSNNYQEQIKQIDYDINQPKRIIFSFDTKNISDYKQ